MHKVEPTVTQAKQTDFAKYAQLSESEQKVIEDTLASIPDDILSTGERAPIESRIRNRLQREGLIEAEGPLGMGTIPPVAYVGRAVGCLAANSLPLRCILHNKPASAIAESMAKVLGECVPGGTEAIKTDILACREQVAGALRALGLSALGDALLGDEDELTRY
jgi:hypothetical protein